MTNKLKYFIANWKMYGHLKSLKSLNKVIKFQKRNVKAKKIKIVYCPPFTLLHPFVQKFKNSNIKTGAQNCSFESKYGPPTGSINAKMIKKAAEEKSAGMAIDVVNGFLSSFEPSQKIFLLSIFIFAPYVDNITSVWSRHFIGSCMAVVPSAKRDANKMYLPSTKGKL